jgi:hypothetical protein
MKVLKYKYNPNKKGVFRVSIVKNPAVGEGDLVLMSAQEIKGVFYSPVMIPDLNINRINPETGENYLVYYDAETVEQLANNYFKQNGNSSTNVEHEADNVEGVYPVESWIVKDPENDKSKALGMPLQKAGTWIMGYKADNPEVLEQVKNKLLQGLSIEGHLDMEEDTDSPIAKFNKHTMSLKKLMDGFEAFKTVLMAAEEEAKNPEEKTAEELAAEEEAKKQEMAGEKTPEEIAAEEEAAKKAAEEGGSPANEVEALKAEIELLKKDKADLEAELATFKNDAVLMSAQLGEVTKAFESYKAVKMSSQKLADVIVEENKNSVSSKVAEMRANRI